MDLTSSTSNQVAVTNGMQNKAAIHTRQNDLALKRTSRLMSVKTLP